jgi:hypothetical protein
MRIIRRLTDTMDINIPKKTGYCYVESEIYIKRYIIAIWL